MDYSDCSKSSFCIKGDGHLGGCSWGYEVPVDPMDDIDTDCCQ